MGNCLGLLDSCCLQLQQQQLCPAKCGCNIDPQNVSFRDLLPLGTAFPSC